jgi:hypothetical protein
MQCKYHGPLGRLAARTDLAFGLPGWLSPWPAQPHPTTTRQNHRRRLARGAKAFVHNIGPHGTI